LITGDGIGPEIEEVDKEALDFIFEKKVDAGDKKIIVLNKI
jgi:hypothetical protein